MFHNLTRENFGMGHFFDGDYVMLDRFEKVAAAYSLGINDDVSWYLDIAAQGRHVYRYDHTINYLPTRHNLFHWEKIGMAAEPQEGFEFLECLISQNGHEGAENMLLKIGGTVHLRLRL